MEKLFGTVTEKKIVGGKNGFGSKLIFIWSTYGKIETVDHVRRKIFTQEYHDKKENSLPTHLDRIRFYFPGL